MCSPKRSFCRPCVVNVGLGSATSTRLQISDIRQVEVQFNPFFATLELFSLGPLEQMMRVTYLWKDQAKKARRIIAGLMESHRKKVDFSRYHYGDVVEAMEELGKAKET